MPYKFEKLSVLVVEDSVPMLEVVANTLKYLGVREVFEATNGEAGYSIYVRERPDIIITDWEMNDVDGLEMIRWIRSNSDSPKRTVPIIIMTGYAAASRVSEARDQGVTEFLVKPFTANELARRLTYVIDHPRDFVETEVFFGPDRRRRAAMEYSGPEKRSEEE
ncbi:MAG TPA: response regulator [Alphaproteobacteria bacterium]